MTLGAWFPLINRCSRAGKVLLLLAFCVSFVRLFPVSNMCEGRHVTEPPAGNKVSLSVFILIGNIDAHEAVMRL